MAITSNYVDSLEKELIWLGDKLQFHPPSQDLGRRDCPLRQYTRVICSPKKWEILVSLHSPVSCPSVFYALDAKA